MRSVVYLLSLLVFVPLRLWRTKSLPLHHVQMTVQSHANCFCHAQGRMFAYGESVCLRTPEGPRLAQCQMETERDLLDVYRAPVP